MADVKDSIPHVERTAADQRQAGFHNANISQIELVNRRIRLVRLSLEKNGPPLRHLPGQYIDLHIPNVPVVGGFTITSPPQTAVIRRVDPSSNQQPPPADKDSSDFPFIELAIQAADANPPAAYLWQDPSSILDRPVTLRVGGNFTYPPATLSLEEFRQVDNVVFVAGGVGVNPIMSMVSAMDLAGPGRLGGMVKRVRVLYSSKRDTGPDGHAGRVLFEDRLDEIAAKYRHGESVDFRMTFFETNAGGQGRITHKDLFEAVGEEEVRKNALVYICGVPSMTDDFVDLLRATDGLDEKRVLCEKWW